MKTVAQLEASRAKWIGELEKLQAKMDAPGYKESKRDRQEWSALTGALKTINAKIERAEEVSNAHALISGKAPSYGHSRPHAQPGRYSGKLKGFQHRIENGILIYAEDEAYRFGNFIAASIFNDEKAKEFCRANGIVIKAQQEGVDSKGGVLVPEEWLGTIINLKEQFGIFKQYAQNVPMNRDSINWPRRTGGVTAAFIQEGTAVTESSASWDNVQLVAKTLAALIRVSNELAEDALISLADWIVFEIAYAFAQKEDDCGWNGDGSGTFGGVQGLFPTTSTTNIGSAGVYTATGHTTLDTITLTDLHLLQGLLPQYAWTGAQWYCTQQFYASIILRLMAAGGGNTIATLNAGASADLRFLGFPVVISQKMPNLASASGKYACVFGRLEMAVAYGDRRQVTIRRSDDRYFDTNQIGLLGNQRFDIVTHDLGTSTTVGPIVTLKMG
jgi:HK97 family phage major capsid protein